MKLKVFISHCWKDKSLAAYKEIEMQLKGHYDLWRDSHDIELGRPIRKTFLEALPEADIVLVLWSENSLKSEDQQLEVRTAHELGKEILPCRISAAYPTDNPYMAGLKFASFEKNLELGLRFVNQHLIKLASRKNAAIARDPGIRRQTAALDDALAELGDVAHRHELRKDQEQAAKVAQSSSTYVRGMAGALRRLAEASDGSAEDRILSKVADRVEAIAIAHPDPKDDELCKSLFVEALAECDPSAESPKVQMFLRALAAGGVTPPSASTPPGNDVPVQAPTPLHAHVFAVLRRPSADGELEQRLRDLGVGAAQVPAYVKSLRQAAQTIPDLLFAMAQAAQQAQIGHLVGPILQKAEGYFLEIHDSIPEQHGTRGLMDDTYLVQAFLVQLNAAYRQSAGTPLVNYDPTATMQVIRPILGEPIAAQIEQYVVAEVNEAVQQSYYEQLSRQQATMNVSPTGGPGAWGSSYEDEIARLSAEIRMGR